VLAQALGLTPEGLDRRFDRWVRERFAGALRGQAPEDESVSALVTARALVERGRVDSAVAQLARVTSRDETAWEANALEAELRERLGDHAGAAAALERLVWIWPYDADVHVRLAALAERLNDHPRAVRERRAVLALDPSDRLEARYQLARALARAGERGAARREILGVLEVAPGFEKGQALLLELSERRNP
jgi:tetratricopeptide (TPR) repeat protein